VIDKQGIIVTNNHVIDGASTIKVILPSDEKNPIVAKVIGHDAKTDLAVLKIETKKELTPINWGNSDAVEVGDWSVAIGSPFMLSHSVTAGIISAKGRNASQLMDTDTDAYWRGVFDYYKQKLQENGVPQEDPEKRAAWEKEVRRNHRKIQQDADIHALLYAAGSLGVFGS
jgi:hypothetical protein